jgi:hypothetical protein
MLKSNKNYKIYKFSGRYRIREGIPVCNFLKSENKKINESGYV